MSQAGIAGTPGGSGSSVVNIAGDTGVATGTTITIKTGVATLNDGQTPQFNNSGSTSILNFSDASGNTILGNGAGFTGSSAGFNTILGVEAGAANLSGMGGNTLFGWKAGNAITTGNNNQATGQSAMLLATTAVQSVAVGNNSLSGLTTGSNNIGIGYQAGQSLTTSDSSNIDIANLGVSGDNNTIRLGTQGTGNGEQNTCFIAGIIGNTVSNTEIVSIDSTTGQLGVLTDPLTVPNGGTGDSSFTAYSVICGGTASTNPLQNVSGVGTSGEVLTSNGAGALPTWQAVGGGAVTPIFSAYNAGGQVLTGNAYSTIVWDTNILNTGGAYDNTTGVFTAPKAGTYHFTYTAFIFGIDATNTLLISVLNDSAYGQIFQTLINPFPITLPGSPSQFQMQGSQDIFMAMGETVSVQIFLGGTSQSFRTGYTFNSFSGYFVG